MPWIIIFGSFVISLKIFPGWLRAFSNTFGLKAAQMYGIDDVLAKIFTLDEKNGAIEAASATQSSMNYKLISVIESVYSSKTVLINELLDDAVYEVRMNPEKTVPILNDKGETVKDLIWNSFDKIVPSFVKNINPDDKKELYDNILLKDTVGYFIWYLLIGSLTVLVSTNTLLNSGCIAEENDFNKIF